MLAKAVYFTFSLSLIMFSQAIPAVLPGSGPALAARDDDFPWWQFGAVNPGSDPNKPTPATESTPTATTSTSADDPNPTSVTENPPPVSNASNGGPNHGGGTASGDGPEQDDIAVDEKPDGDGDDDKGYDYSSHGYYGPGGFYGNWKYKGHKAESQD